MKKICLAIILVGICCLPILNQAITAPTNEETFTVDSDADGLNDGCSTDVECYDDMEFWVNLNFWGVDTDQDGVSDGYGPPCPFEDGSEPQGFRIRLGDTSQDGVIAYVELFVDLDYDYVLNREDNCPRIPNPDQLDSDMNNVGDACEPPVIKKTTGSTKPDNKPQPEPKEEPDPQPNKWAHFSNEGDKLRRLIQLAGNSKS